MYEFDRSTPVTVALRAHGGAVELLAEERDTVVVEVIPYADNDQARDVAAKTRVLIEDDTLLIQAPGSDYWAWRRSAKLRIVAKVPIGSVLAGKSSAADVRAAGVWSTVRLDASSADIDVAEVTGDADLDTASGTVTVHRVGGSLRAKSSSGDVRVGDVTGDANLETASGDIRLRRGENSVRAYTASGDIEVGELRQGRAQLKSSSGDVEVGVAAGTGVWMDLDTSSGKSVSDLTASGPTPPPTGANLELRVKTASGDIHVRRVGVPANRTAA
jgi:hypothetical protein